LTRSAAAAALLLAACACAPSRLDVIQVGPWSGPRDWREVEVFSSRSQTTRPWGGIAVLHSPRVSAASGGAKLEQLKSQARRQAAGIGADAVIIAVESASAGPQLGVYEEPELFISALAIKYVTVASTPSAK
jgi:hypothetical protein